MALKSREIARALNLSPATVSLVLNNKPGVGSENRQRVLDYIAAMGYDANALMKPALRNSRNIRFVVYKKHGLVVSDTPFFSALIEGIEQEARREGYNLVVSYLNEKENGAEVIRVIADNPLDGILLLATEMAPADLQPFLALGCPLVALDSRFPGLAVDSVQIDNRMGAAQAAGRLLECGHTDIGYLHSSVWIHNFDERRDGFLQALARAGVAFDKRRQYDLESTLEGAGRDMAALLAGKPGLPTAFFADNDLIASGAIRALRERGVAIPGDVSVVGFDDMPFCELLDPPLDTVRVFKQRMGMVAVRRLIDRIADRPEETIRIEVSTELVKRQSVRQLNKEELP
jgi:DNA-binding LacI/PurR family transcriptional regulator